MIGALSLLIVALALGGSAEVDPGDTIPHPDVTAQQAHDAEGQEKVAVRGAQVRARQKELDELLKRLRNMTEYRQGLREELRAKRDAFDEQDTERASLEQELAALMAAIEEAARRLAEAKEQYRVRKERGPAHPIEIPEGKYDYNPVFVLCHATGIRVLPTGDEIRTDAIEDSERVEQLVASIKQSEQWCLFLLVHERGVAAFNEISWEARSAGIRMGYHAVRSDRDLDVSNWPRPSWLR